jgi:hypothetical protein
VLVRRDTDEEQYRLRISIADLGLQSDVRERLAQLLELRNCLTLIYFTSAFMFPPSLFTSRTRLRKAIADHIIDVQIRLERLRLCHFRRRRLNKGEFEVIDLGGQTREARNTGR